LAADVQNALKLDGTLLALVELNAAQACASCSADTMGAAQAALLQWVAVLQRVIIGTPVALAAEFRKADNAVVRRSIPYHRERSPAQMDGLRECG
jgi:hypothetical protein